MRILLNTQKKTFKMYNIKDNYIKCIAEDKLNNNPKVLIKYLEKSEPLSVVLDSTKCVISNAEIENHYETLVTDGIWIWSADLLHYTKNYNFKFPGDFLDYLESINYETSTLSREEMAELYFGKYKLILDDDGLIDLDKLDVIELDSCDDIY